MSSTPIVQNIQTPLMNEKIKYMTVSDEDNVEFDFETLRMNIIGQYRTITLDFSCARIQWNQVLFQTKRASMVSNVEPI